MADQPRELSWSQRHFEGHSKPFYRLDRTPSTSRSTTGYEVEFRGSASGTWTPLIDDTGNVRSYTYQDMRDRYGIASRVVRAFHILAHDPDRQFRIRAISGTLKSGWTESQLVVHLDAPHLRTVVPGDWVPARNSQTLVAHWDPLTRFSSITSYVVQWRLPQIDWTDTTTFPASAGSTVGTGIPPATSHTITGLEDGFLYLVRVGAVTPTARRAGPTSSPPAQRRTAPLPLFPAVIGYAGRLVIVGSPPGFDGGSSIVEYTLQWKSGNQDWDEVNRQMESGDRTFTLSGLTGGVE